MAAGGNLSHRWKVLSILHEVQYLFPSLPLQQMGLLPSYDRVMACKIYIELPTLTLDRQLDLNMKDFG